MNAETSQIDSSVHAMPPTARTLPSTILLPVRLDRVTREALLDYFENTWSLYDWLFESITESGALYSNPDPLRHPLIFYLGHTAAFYLNKLQDAGVIEHGIDERHDDLFARGVDPKNSKDLEHFEWPAEEVVWAYRRKAFEIVREVIETADLSQPITDSHPLWSLMMGFEHDRIHFETSSVLIRQYPVSALTRPEGWTYAPTDGVAPEPDMIHVEPGTVWLGKDRDFPTFGWDNEYGKLEVAVNGFEAGRNLVTNAEYLAFVEDGGYERRDLWTDEGWQWKTKEAVQCPRFWVREGGSYRYRAMFDVLEMPLAWPAEVNCHEARAFCRFRGEEYRLLSESEFARITSTYDLPADDVMFTDAFNLNFKYGSPSAVGSLPRARSERGFNDVYGNVWVWLSNDFYPFPGYEVHHLYKDFSEPFMDADHATLLGGSWATTGTGASKFYRLWFRRQFFQHAGFRLSRDAG